MHLSKVTYNNNVLKIISIIVYFTAVQYLFYHMTRSLRMRQEVPTAPLNDIPSRVGIELTCYFSHLLWPFCALISPSEETSLTWTDAHTPLTM